MVLDKTVAISCQIAGLAAVVLIGAAIAKIRITTSHDEGWFDGYQKGYNQGKVDLSAEIENL